MARIEEKVEQLLKDKIEETGYELYDVEYVKEGKNYFLRIFIDNPKGIDLEDCEKVNDAIMDLLDQADYIKEQYFLEVSSPGIERILRKDKHLEDNIGNEVEIKQFKKDENGKKEYQGILKSFDSETITLGALETVEPEETLKSEVSKTVEKTETSQVVENEIKIERKNIALIKTIYHW